MNNSENSDFLGKVVLESFVQVTVDCIFAYPVFLASIAREAHTEAHVFSNLPPLMQEVAGGKGFFATVAKHAAEAPMATLSACYSNVGTYITSVYLMMLSAEKLVHKFAVREGFSETSALFSSAIAGGLIATPGENLMVKGNSLKHLLKPGGFSMRGFMPAIARELLCSSVAVAKVDKQIAKCFSSESPLMSHEVGSLGASVILATTQVPARFAAVMRNHQVGFFRAHHLLIEDGKKHVAKICPQKPLLRQALSFINGAYFPGGMLRMGCLTLTAHIYTSINYLFERHERQTPRPN